jgi:hypothetical protein
MYVTKVLTKDYENKRLFRRAENKPKQTQFYPNMLIPPLRGAGLIWVKFFPPTKNPKNPGIGAKTCEN